MTRAIPNYKIKLIRQNYLNKTCTNSKLAIDLRISPPIVYKYIRLFKEIAALYPEQSNNVNFFLPKVKLKQKPNVRQMEVLTMFPLLVKEAQTDKVLFMPLWLAYHEQCPKGYKFETFKVLYLKWRKDNNICLFAHRKVKEIFERDKVLLQHWLDGFNHEEWRKAIVIKESFEGVPLFTISSEVKLTIRTMQKWIALYNESGLDGLKRKISDTNARWIKPGEERTINLMKLLHETPKLHGLNRTSWRVKDLVTAYYNYFGSSISASWIGSCLRKNGFVFKKARMVLTSPDPKFREKLDHIKSILSNLKDDEKFFSVDEFGPCSIKMKQGWEFVKAHELKTVKQFQKSKGWFICTAALELSTNQVTHFYSLNKDTDEMIKLITQLLLQYPTQKKLYISWDAAGWHNSNRLKDFIKGVNELAKLDGPSMPCVELAPLPSSAQFLNIIESVFSGLAKSVIHNSDYNSVAECKQAIDVHFRNRNEHFKHHHKRAGNIIWGKELVKSEFDEAHNCKDPKY
jgi:transposase